MCGNYYLVNATMDNIAVGTSICSAILWILHGSGSRLLHVGTIDMI